MARHAITYIIIAVVFFIILAAVSPGPAATGKTLFAQKCLSCHNRGGEASVINPAKYASIQWMRFFNKQKHAKKYQDISGQITPRESALVLEFLINHAADSDKPEA